MIPLPAYIDFLTEFEQHAIPSMVYDRIAAMHHLDRDSLRQLFESAKHTRLLRKSNPLHARAATYILTPIGVQALKTARKESVHEQGL